MPNQEIELRNRILGVTLQKERNRARISRRECAEVIGVSERRYKAYEEGTKAISLPELELLASFLRVPLDTFRSVKGIGQAITAPKLPDPAMFRMLRQRIIGARVRQARFEAQRTQQELAEILGVSTSKISKYEEGETPIPMSELEVIGYALGISFNEFREYESNVGEWLRLQEQFSQFAKLPPEVREFIVRPVNIRYLELGMKLAQMPAGSLRAIAEGLLEITF